MILCDVFRNQKFTRTETSKYLDIPKLEQNDFKCETNLSCIVSVNFNRFLNPERCFRSILVVNTLIHFVLLTVILSNPKNLKHATTRKSGRSWDQRKCELICANKHKLQSSRLSLGTVDMKTSSASMFCGYWEKTSLSNITQKVSFEENSDNWKLQIKIR